MKTSTLEEQSASSMQLLKSLRRYVLVTTNIPRFWKSLKLVFQVTLLPRGCTALMPPHQRHPEVSLQERC